MSRPKFFRLDIRMEGAAFGSPIRRPDEIAFILAQATERVRSGETDFVLRDVKGNCVGAAWVYEE